MFSSIAAEAFTSKALTPALDTQPSLPVSGFPGDGLDMAKTGDIFLYVQPSPLRKNRQNLRTVKTEGRDPTESDLAFSLHPTPFGCIWEQWDGLFSYTNRKVSEPVRHGITYQPARSLRSNAGHRLRRAESRWPTH
jgi:hypothetical protein